jgi:CO/xanthine dehydrogenase FAD-binding subunit
LKAGPSNYYLGANVFAGGDFLTGPSTVVEAIAAGREAAGSIHQYLGGKKRRAKAKENQGWKFPDKFNSSCIEITRRVSAPELPVSERIKSFNVEEVGGLDRSAVEIEANRCFNCGCIAVNPSDIAPALVAMDARIVTSKRTINAEQFWAADKVTKSTMLESDEIVTEIQIPAPLAGIKSAFIKFALRRSIDFPIVNCAAAVRIETGIVKSSRICLNSVYAQPYRATEAENVINGKPIDEANAEAAGAAAVSDAIALSYNKYKIQMAKTLVKRAILACQ